MVSYLAAARLSLVGQDAHDASIGQQGGIGAEVECASLCAHRLVSMAAERTLPRGWRQTLNDELAHLNEWLGLHGAGTILLIGDDEPQDFEMLARSLHIAAFVNGAGYDVLSYDETTESAMFVEVKNSSAPEGHDGVLYMSENECSQALALGRAWRCWLRTPLQSNCWKDITAPLQAQLPQRSESSCMLRPTQYSVSLAALMSHFQGHETQ